VISAALNSSLTHSGDEEDQKKVGFQQPLKTSPNKSGGVIQQTSPKKPKFMLNFDF